MFLRIIYVCVFIMADVGSWFSSGLMLKGLLWAVINIKKLRWVSGDVSERRSAYFVEDGLLKSAFVH